MSTAAQLRTVATTMTGREMAEASRKTAAEAGSATVKKFFEANRKLAGKRALVTVTLGGREHMFGEGAVHGPLEDMLRPILRGTLAYVGYDVLAPFVAWHVPYISADARQDFLVGYDQRLRGLADEQPLVFPKLAQFDEALYPLP